MFNKQNFCHVASNNRNEKKAGIFVYKTTDDLATVSVSGYFNEKIVDINLHDLIIHEWHDATDRTKVQKNVLCVTERTLDNVGTVVIKSKWEEDTDQAIADLQTYVDNTFVRKDGTSVMTGPLKFHAGSFVGAIAGGLGDGISVYKLKSDDTIDSEVASLTKTNGFVPGTTNTINIGSNSLKWKDLYLAGNANIGGKLFVATINNGADLTVPTTGGTIATTGNTVTIDSNQTIKGQKTFTTNTIYKLSTKPDGSNHYNTPIIMQDSDGVTRGYLRNIYLASGSNMVGIQAQQEVGGVLQYASLDIGFDNNGDAYTNTVAPAASSSTSSTQIATVGFVNDATKSTNVVHRDSTETITGSKIFTNNVKFQNGSTTTYNGFMYKTSNGNLSLGIMNSDNSSWLSNITFSTAGGIGISPASGQVVNVPTPSAGSNSVAAATTAWVKTYAMGTPDWSSQTPVSAPWTATKNGYIYAYQYGGDAHLRVFINQTSTTIGDAGYHYVGGFYGPQSGTTASGLIPVRIGDVVSLEFTNTAYLYFVPCKNL